MSRILVLLVALHESHGLNILPLGQLASRVSSAAIESFDLAPSPFAITSVFEPSIFSKQRTVATSLATVTVVFNQAAEESARRIASEWSTTVGFTVVSATRIGETTVIVARGSRHTLRRFVQATQQDTGLKHATWS